MAFTEEEKRQRKNERQREYAKRTGYAANKKYDETHKENVVVVSVKLYQSKDGDMIEYLRSKSSKSGYIKDLIRKDMKKDENNT